MSLELLQGAYIYVDLNKSSDISIRLDNDFYLIHFSKLSFNLKEVVTACCTGYARSQLMSNTFSYPKYITVNLYPYFPLPAHP
jgi:hypothetical protein